MARTCIAASARHGGGNRGPIFTDYEINNFLDIMGDVMLIKLAEVKAFGS
jgi:hypothetical protein